MADIQHQVPISKPSKEVYDAFATAEGLLKWWPLECTGTPEVGAEYRLYFGAPYDWRAEVTRADRGKAFEWRFTQAMDDWIGTRVGILLIPTGEGCMLNFYHSGWAKADGPFAHTNYCWALLLKGLKDYVEKGVVLPFEQRA